MEVAITTKNEDDAKEMRETLAKGLKFAQAGLLLLGGDGKEVNFAVEVIKSLRVSGKGKVVAIQGKIAPDTIEDALKKD
jgi:hypothetical protein